MRTGRAMSVNAATAGSIIAEWKACVVCRRMQAAPRSADSRRSSSSSASAGPPMTQKCGPLVAETERRPSSSGLTSASGSGTASMPPAGRSWISFARRATSASASSSESTPARQAATYSPML